jgi:hypothetical protein
MKRVFKIRGYPYSERWGGQMALYKLRDNLIYLGEKAQIVFENQGNLVEPEDIVVYPEVIYGNPFGSKTIVRWILNTPGVAGGDGVFGNEDKIYLWSSMYSVDSKYKISGFLTAFDFHLDLFVDKGLSRSGTCYVVRKGWGKKLNQHPADAVCIDDYFDRGGNKWLAEVFNQYKTFISYDHCTQLSVCAALCGCESVVIPEEGLSREGWKKANGLFSQAIRYGLDDQLDSSRDSLRENLKTMELESIQQTKDFVNSF